jgi:hypothetical protein
LSIFYTISLLTKVLQKDTKTDQLKLKALGTPKTQLHRQKPITSALQSCLYPFWSTIYTCCFELCKHTVFVVRQPSQTCTLRGNPLLGLQQLQGAHLQNILHAATARLVPPAGTWYTLPTQIAPTRTDQPSTAIKKACQLFFFHEQHHGKVASYPSQVACNKLTPHLS